MLPVWIAYASNFDLNIPEYHITDSSHRLYIVDSLGAQYHDMKLSLYRYQYVSQIPTRVCANYVPLCVCVHVCVCLCVCVCVCVYTYVCVYIHTCEFKYPIEYVKIYRSSSTFDTHSSLVIFDEHLVW